MRIIDFTHTLREDISLFPGSEKPVIKQTAWPDEDGFAERKLEFTGHTGTHMDSPAHVFEDGITLDMMDISAFSGKAVVADCQDVTGEIGPDCLKNLGQVDFVLFCTGWSRYWGEEKYVTDYPYLSDETIDLLIKMKVRGVGLDTIGADPVDSMEIHKKLLEQGILIIENLRNLEDAIGKEFMFYGLPLKYEGADGAPVRAIGVIYE